MAKRPTKPESEQLRRASKARAARLHEKISDLIRQAAAPAAETAGAGVPASQPSPREFIQKRMAQLGGMPKPAPRSAAKKAPPKK